MVVPAFLLLITGILEFGLMFDHLMTISYATREGARSGAAFASGNDTTMVCTASVDIDKNIVAAVQRVLDAPGSQVKKDRVSEIRIYLANSSGAQSGSSANVWVYGAGSGPIVDGENLDFRVSTTGWNACARDNTWTGSAAPDSLGVSVVYDYRMATPLGSIMGFFGPNGPVSVRMSDRTVMALNPTD
jgi:hypothetical protein